MTVEYILCHIAQHQTQKFRVHAPMDTKQITTFVGRCVICDGEAKIRLTCSVPSTHYRLVCNYCLKRTPKSLYFPREMALRKEVLNQEFIKSIE